MATFMGITAEEINILKWIWYLSTVLLISITTVCAYALTRILVLLEEMKRDNKGRPANDRK
jgi:hypothetical protein